MPEQRTHAFILAHIAQHSVREIDGGWTWKHDPLIYQADQGAPSDPSDASCPIALIHPEHGLSDKTGGAVFGTTLSAPQSVVIPGAAHHVMMDEPLALVACLRTLLSGPPWCAAGGAPNTER